MCKSAVRQIAALSEQRQRNLSSPTHSSPHSGNTGLSCCHSSILILITLNNAAYNYLFYLVRNVFEILFNSFFKSTVLNEYKMQPVQGIFPIITLCVLQHLTTLLRYNVYGWIVGDLCLFWFTNFILQM